MFRLLYISTARKVIDAVALQSILKSARIANRSKGLTGLLVYDGHRFLQYLEGETLSAGFMQRLKPIPDTLQLLLFVNHGVSSDSSPIGTWLSSQASALLSLTNRSNALRSLLKTVTY